VVGLLPSEPLERLREEHFLSLPDVIVIPLILRRQSLCKNRVYYGKAMKTAE
jgi:hypothetical protein